VNTIALAFEATARNAPLQRFVESLTGGSAATNIRISRQQFEARCPQLFHELEEFAHA